MNPFDRLAPFIKEFIWRQGWAEIRQMQGEAINRILDTRDHLLLAGQTASGKTEAAFLPILTDLDANPAGSIGVVYIGPLKALINDQFHRLDFLLEHAGIPVWPWHGDVSQAVKNRAVKERRGVLQTTPESMEGFLLYRNQHLRDLFCDLRYVVIDEVHAFMASDRGRQVLCQLARLERLLNVQPRRVGLSATLGDYAAAEEWLRGGTDRTVTTIDDRSTMRRLKLALEHYQITNEDDEPPFMQQLFNLTRQRKCLVFANSRSNVEDIGAGLRDIAERERMPDTYFVHHGSISKDYRLDAEEAMRDENRPACTVATVTLELGIDLGQLERVVQVGASSSVSSFVQRLGRTGRRGEPGEMFFFTLDEPKKPTDHPLEHIPWGLLLCVAQIQLYLEERWVEPVVEPQYPYSLLYHQTMSVLMQHGDMTPSELAQRVLSLPPFVRVGPESYKTLLRHMLETEQLQWTEQQRLLIGLEGESVVNDWRFLATFQDTAEYDVMCDAEHVGSLASAPPIDTVIRLAGRTWRVDGVDERQRTVIVSRTRGKAKTAWAGEGGGIHDRVVHRVWQALGEDVVYPYLQERARERLREARDVARQGGILKGLAHPLSASAVALLPWVGSPALRALRVALGTRVGWNNVAVTNSFFLVVKSSEQRIKESLASPLSLEEVRDNLPLTQIPRPHKFDSYIPDELLRDRYLSDDLELERAFGILVEWLDRPLALD